MTTKPKMTKNNDTAKTLKQSQQKKQCFSSIRMVVVIVLRNQQHHSRQNISQSNLSKTTYLTDLMKNIWEEMQTETDDHHWKDAHTQGIS